MTIAYDILQEILDIVEVKLGKRNQSNFTSTDDSDDDDIFYENYHTNETSSGDETEGVDEDYDFERQDL